MKLNAPVVAARVGKLLLVPTVEVEVGQLKLSNVPNVMAEGKFGTDMMENTMIVPIVLGGMFLLFFPVTNVTTVMYKFGVAPVTEMERYRRIGSSR